MNKFGIGATFAWNGKKWKITGFKSGKAVIEEVGGSIKTTIDLNLLMKL